MALDCLAGQRMMGVRPATAINAAVAAWEWPSVRSAQRLWASASTWRSIAGRPTTASSKSKAAGLMICAVKTCGGK
jgi:hypothetical protein